MLQAGYVEDWQYHKTHSGTPQGGVISPILANIYLHELDVFMEQKKQEFDQGKARRKMREWQNTSFYIQYHRKRVDALKEDTSQEARVKQERHMQRIRELRETQRSLPASDPLDPNYRRLFYVRYADDYLIGIIGSKQDAETLCEEVKSFLNNTLKLEISEEKSGIHHAKEGTPFLGYVVQNQTTDKLLRIHRKDTKVVGTRRTMKEIITLRVPQLKMREFCQRKGYGDYEMLKPSHRISWVVADDEEILLAYNAEMQGLANYYALANRAKRELSRLLYMGQRSFFATLANKHDSTISQIAKKLRRGNDYTVTTHTKEGKPKRYTLFKLKNWTPPQAKHDADKMPSTMHLRHGRSSLEQRLKADICESCGKDRGYFEVHHVRKLKDLMGKTWWERVMITRKRKTMVLCVECHDLLHTGRLSNRQKEF
jgi:Type II intron maturase/Reverse transcriptase (RNA-dependent DNA polymerase)